eukprot:jgi/Botrbrau1/11800/Bobra.0224s0007.1
MAEDVQQYAICVTSAKRKLPDKRSPWGYCNPSSYPMCPWHTVTMEFTNQLPHAEDGHDANLVVIDKLTNTVHLVPTTMMATAKLFVNHVWKAQWVTSENVVSIWMGPKSAGRKAAASAAAQAASKKKTSALQLSVNDEALVRDALKSINLGRGASSLSSSGQDADTVVQVYESLLEHRFLPEHIQQALQALAGQRITEDAALDWLCLHLDPKELPRRFAGNAGSRSTAGPVRVLAKADPRAAARRGITVWMSQTWYPHSPGEAGLLGTEVEAGERKGSGGGWRSGSQEDAVEDWELWGDPREIERRKAERQRRTLPPDVLRRMLAEEWSIAKAEAAKAKAAGDKSRQKAVGQLIASLKQQIKELGPAPPSFPSGGAGLREEDLEGLLSEGGSTKRNGQSGPAPPTDEDEWPALDAAFPPLPGALSQQNARKSCCLRPPIYSTVWAIFYLLYNWELSRDQLSARNLPRSGLSRLKSTVCASLQVCRTPSGWVGGPQWQKQREGAGARQGDEPTLAVDVEPVKEERKGTAEEGEEEEDNLEGGMGLFDEDAEGGGWEAPEEKAEQRLERLLRLQPPAPSTRLPKKERGRGMVMGYIWGLGRRKSTDKGGTLSCRDNQGGKVRVAGERVGGAADRPAPPQVEVKAPKALLQQHCMKKGMPPPRFEKREVGGHRGPTPGQRYSVTLEAPVLSGPRKKGARRPAPRSFSLREADDGWDTVQDAQNAAAAFALFKGMWLRPYAVPEGFLCSELERLAPDGNP